MAIAEERAAISLRHRHHEAVASNRVSLAKQWGQPCHAFNVHIDPSIAAREGLARVQDLLEEIEPRLLRCPTSALHVSVAWLLAVHIDYGEPKATIWARRGVEWTAELDRIAAEHEPFEMRYRWLVVTDSAVIAVAEPVSPVRGIRADIATKLALPERTKNNAEIVHTTLFRYRSPLSHPKRLLAAADSIEFTVSTRAEKLTVSEELAFPSLRTSTKARLALGKKPSALGMAST